MTKNKTDLQLKEDVEAELMWDPKVNAAQVGVTVDKGAVSLLGSVDTYAAKWAAEDAIKRVCGVRSFAQDLKVKVLAEHKRSDSEIAAAVLNSMKWDVAVPASVTAKVENGDVTLTGKVDGNYQREAAERAVRNLMGVVSVFNAIVVKASVSTEQVKEKIQAALFRQGAADAKSIHVDAAGGKVTLSGHTSSWQSMEDATNAAWATPGVFEVVDQMKLQPTF